MELAHENLRVLTEASGIDQEQAATAELRYQVYFNSLWILMTHLDPALKLRSYKLLHAIPWKITNPNYIDTINSCAELGYAVRKKVLNDKQLKTLQPTLIVNRVDESKVYVVYNENNHTIIYDPINNQHITDNEHFVLSDYWAYEFHLQEAVQFKESWFKTVCFRFAPILISMILLSIVLHVLSLSLPLYIIYVYTNVISSENTQSLIPVTIGVVVVLLADQWLKNIRANATGWLGARIDFMVTQMVIKKMSLLQISDLETVSPSAQIARIKSFISLRDFFTSAIFSSVLEFPAVALMIILLSVFHFYFTIITFLVCVFFLVMVKVFSYFSKLQIEISSEEATAKHNIMLEFFDKMASLKRTGLKRHYIFSIAKQSLKALNSNIKTLLIGDSLEAFGKCVSEIGVISCLLVGVHLIKVGEISPPVLVAATYLMWRIFNPIQVLASTVIRTEKIKKSITQIDDFLEVPEEKARHATSVHIAKMAGNIEFKSVALHVKSSNVLTLRNFSVKLKHGDIMVIDEDSTQLSSAIAQLLLGARKPNLGVVMVDNCDITQFNLTEYRQYISYMPAECLVLHDTILMNIKVANPFVADEQIVKILDYLGAMGEIESLEDGLETLLLPDNQPLYSKSLLHSINLARFYMRNTPIKVLEGLNMKLLNPVARSRVVADIKKWHKKATMVVSTSDPEISALATVMLRADKKNGYKVIQKV